MIIQCYKRRRSCLQCVEWLRRLFENVWEITVREGVSRVVTWWQSVVLKHSLTWLRTFFPRPRLQLVTNNHRTLSIDTSSRFRLQACTKPHSSRGRQQLQPHESAQLGLPLFSLKCFEPLTKHLADERRHLEKRNYEAFVSESGWGRERKVFGFDQVAKYRKFVREFPTRAENNGVRSTYSSRERRRWII